MNSRGCRRTEHALPRPADGSGESGPSRGSAVAKVRVYELAKEFGVESKAVMAKLQEMGEFVRSASSTIEAPVVRRLKEAFAAQQPKQARASQAAGGRSAAAPVAPAVVAADDGHGATNGRSPAAPVAPAAEAMPAPAAVEPASPAATAPAADGSPGRPPVPFPQPQAEAPAAASETAPSVEQPAASGSDTSPRSAPRPNAPRPGSGAPGSGAPGSGAP